MGPKQVLPLQVRMNPGLMAMKVYLTLPKLKPHHQIQFNVISMTQMNNEHLA